MAIVKFNLLRLNRFKQSVADKTGLRDVFTQWGKRYLTFTKRRYKKNAEGGGEWPRLKSISYRRATGSELRFAKTGRRRISGQQSAIKQRYLLARKKVKILIDTGTLFKALSINMPGNLFRHIKAGIRVGFAGVRLHKGSESTVKDIAMKHQKGDPSKNLPQRKILHVPSATVRAQMMKDLKQGLRKLGQRQ